MSPEKNSTLLKTMPQAAGKKDAEFPQGFFICPQADLNLAGYKVNQMGLFKDKPGQYLSKDCDGVCMWCFIAAAMAVAVSDPLYTY